MPFSASTCLTYTGTTTLGPTFKVYTNPTSPTIPGTYLMDVPTSSITGGNCPYTFIVPDNTTTIRLFDPISLCYADIPITTPGSQTGYCTTRCLPSQPTPPPPYASPCWSNVLQPKLISSSPSLEVGSILTGTDGGCYEITEVISPANYPLIAGPVMNSTGTLNNCYQCKQIAFTFSYNLPTPYTCNTSSTDFFYYRTNNGPWISSQVTVGINSSFNFILKEGSTIDFYFSTNNNKPWAYGFIYGSSDYTSKCGQTVSYTVANVYNQNIYINIDAVASGTDCQFGTPC